MPIQKRNDWITIAAAAAMGAVTGASVVALFSPVQPHGWPEVLAMSAFTAFGLLATGAITFAAAERSAGPARSQAAVATIGYSKEMLAEVTDIRISAMMAYSACKDVTDANRGMSQFTIGESFERFLSKCRMSDKYDEYGHVIGNYDARKSKINEIYDSVLSYIRNFDPEFIPSIEINVDQDAVDAIYRAQDEWLHIAQSLTKYKTEILRVIGESHRIIHQATLD